MGFFSSIGDFVSDAWDGVKDAVGGVVDTVTPFLGPAGDVVGGLLGSDSRKEVNAQNTAFAREQLQFQKDYIQNRLQWQVEDAKKAGLHPMVGAGISPTSFSPVSLRNSPIDTDWVGEAGQNISYASAKAKDRQQQQEAWNFTKDMNEAQIEGVRLDNELKVMQILSQVALLNQTGPSAPTLNTNKPDARFPSDSTFTPDVIPLLGAARLGNSLFLHYNQDIADAVSEDMARSIAATIATTGQLERLMPEIARKFTKAERDALKRGDAELKVISPYQVQILYHSKFKPRRDSQYQYSGKILPF